MFGIFPHVIVLLVDIIGMLVHNTIGAVLEASFETKIELLCLFLPQQQRYSTMYRNEQTQLML